MHLPGLFALVFWDEVRNLGGRAGGKASSARVSKMLVVGGPSNEQGAQEGFGGEEGATADLVNLLRGLCAALSGGSRPL